MFGKLFKVFGTHYIHMEHCEKCNSNYILITRTIDNEIVSICCMQCGYLKKINPNIIKKIDINYEKFKQEIGETQGCVGCDCFI